MGRYEMNMASKTEGENRIYAAIDLKSFYASVECNERGLDPLTTNLVVADTSRTDKTICLAVSPSLEALGISGRPRLFEVKQKLKEINARRMRKAPGGKLDGASFYAKRLQEDPTLAVDYIAAVPRMAKYMEYSRHIYAIYLRYIAPEDIHVYSIDEVFIDLTDYGKLYGKTARELTEHLIHEVLKETGITATAGIGTNMYLAKAAMDIVAKHLPADAHGVRIAELNESSYRRILWAHEPLTDFWRVGKGIAAKLNARGMYTMGDIARQALKDEGVFYQMFGVNAEYLIDHAFGVESTTIADIRRYKPENHSIGSGQVLPEGYTHAKGRMIVREMAEALADDMLEKGYVSDCFVLYVGYDIDNLRDPQRAENYRGKIVKDWYGRTVPKAGGGTARLDHWTCSAKEVAEALLSVYERTTDHNLLVRRINVSAAGVLKETEAPKKQAEQLDLFSDVSAQIEKSEKEEAERARERKAREAVLQLKKRFGKNAVLKGADLEEGAMTVARNRQIGGHKA